jgi:hypothetical protein
LGLQWLAAFASERLRQRDIEPYPVGGDEMSSDVASCVPKLRYGASTASAKLVSKTGGTQLNSIADR